MLSLFWGPLETGLLESGSLGGVLAGDEGYELNHFTLRSRRQNDAEAWAFRHDPLRQANKGKTIVTMGYSIGGTLPQHRAGRTGQSQAGGGKIA